MMSSVRLDTPTTFANASPPVRCAVYARVPKQNVLFMDLSKWPHIKTWLTRCWERPAAKEVRAMQE